MKSDTLLTISSLVLLAIVTIITISLIVCDDDPYGKELSSRGSDHIEWKSYYGQHYEYDLDISEKDFTDSFYRPVRRTIGSFGGSYDQFLTPNEPHIVRIAQYIDGLAYSEYTKALLTLNFVQCAVDYAYDTEIYGTTEHFAYPIETLYLGVGDCEDTAFLTCSIMLALGLDAKLVQSDGHMEVCVCIDGYSPSVYLENDGKHYGVCNTTASCPTPLFIKALDEGVCIVEENKDVWYFTKTIINNSIFTLKSGFCFYMEQAGIERGYVDFTL